MDGLDRLQDIHAKETNAKLFSKDDMERDKDTHGTYKDFRKELSSLIGDNVHVFRHKMDK